jgi:hypothetical protein
MQAPIAEGQRRALAERTRDIEQFQWSMADPPPFRDAGPLRLAVPVPMAKGQNRVLAERTRGLILAERTRELRRSNTRAVARAG